MANTPEPVKKPKRPAHTSLPRENPFRAISQMFHASVGKLPAHLVVLFVVSLAVTVLFGLLVEVNVASKISRDAYLPLTIKPDAAKPVLTEEGMKGVWVHEEDTRLTTLRMGNGIFEMIVRNSSQPYTRFFVRGGYRLEGNVLIMQVRGDLGAASDPDHLDIKYYPIALERLNLYAENNGTAMAWHIPSSQATAKKRLLDAFRSPDIGWTRIAYQP